MTPESSTPAPESPRPACIRPEHCGHGGACCGTPTCCARCEHCHEPCCAEDARRSTR